jgi:hypothetical protein
MRPCRYGLLYSSSRGNRRLLDADFDAVRMTYLLRLKQNYRRIDLDVLTPAEHDDHIPVLLQSVFVPNGVRADPPPMELSRGSELVEEFDSYLRGRYQLSPSDSMVVARVMLRQFHTRNFILSRYGGDVYGFIHRAFLEYFCADEIVQRFESRRELSPQQVAFAGENGRTEPAASRRPAGYGCQEGTSATGMAPGTGKTAEAAPAGGSNGRDHHRGHLLPPGGK